jgi:hypothetical protein
MSSSYFQLLGQLGATKQNPTKYRIRVGHSTDRDSQDGYPTPSNPGPLADAVTLSVTLGS